MKRPFRAIQWNSQDFILGALSLGFAAVIAWQTYPTLEFMTEGRVGPGYFPTLVAGGIAFIGVVLICKSLVQSGPVFERIDWRPLGFVTAAVLLFSLVTTLGLAITAIVVVTFGGMALRKTPLLRLLLLAAFLAVAASVVFSMLMGLQLRIWP